MELDITGTEAVLKLIEQSGHSKFNILKLGATRTPVFEFSGGRDNKEALAAFKQWAHTMTMGNNSSAYDIVLYTQGSADEEEEAKGKKGRIKFSFALNRNAAQIAGIGSANINEAIDAAVTAALAKRDAEDMKKQLDEMRATMEAMEEEEEDEDELGAAPEQDALTKLAPIFASILGVKLPASAPTAMAGTPNTEETKNTFTPTQIANFSKALKIMYKHNKELDSDLLKLAAISENNPGQFDMLISALRSM